MCPILTCGQCTLYQLTLYPIKNERNLLFFFMAWAGTLYRVRAEMLSKICSWSVFLFLSWPYIFLHYFACSFFVHFSIHEVLWSNHFTLFTVLKYFYLRPLIPFECIFLNYITEMMSYMWKSIQQLPNYKQKRVQYCFLQQMNQSRHTFLIIKHQWSWMGCPSAAVTAAAAAALAAAAWCIYFGRVLNN